MMYARGRANPRRTPRSAEVPLKRITRTSGSLDCSAPGSRRGRAAIVHQIISYDTESEPARRQLVVERKTLASSSRRGMTMEFGIDHRFLRCTTTIERRGNDERHDPDATVRPASASVQCRVAVRMAAGRARGTGGREPRQWRRQTDRPHLAKRRAARQLKGAGGGSRLAPRAQDAVAVVYRQRAIDVSAFNRSSERLAAALRDHVARSSATDTRGGHRRVVRHQRFVPHDISMTSRSLISGNAEKRGVENATMTRPTRKRQRNTVNP